MEISKLASIPINKPTYITPQNIVIAVLVLALIYYFYCNTINAQINAQINTQIKETFTQYSSLKGDKTLSNTVQFDTNSYIRQGNKVLKINNNQSLPVINYALIDEGTYEYYVGTYFRKHIYPIQFAPIASGLDVIYKMIAGDIDIAFINEELLTRFIKRDCKYLAGIVKANLQLPATVSLNDPQVLKKVFPDTNLSAIGIGYHQDFYLIVSNFSNIVNFPDIQNKTVGVWGDSYYDFIKLCAAWGLHLSVIDPALQPDFTLTVEPALTTLINKFGSNEYDAIFIVCHPKNKHLLDLTLNYKVRFIHLQKRIEIGTKSPINATVNSQQGSGGGFFNGLPAPDPRITSVANLRKYYSNEDFAGKSRSEVVKIAGSYDINSDLDKIFESAEAASQVKDSIVRKYKSQLALHYNLVSNKDKETFNEYIRKYYQYLYPKSVDLLKFYRTGNLQSYLETYSQRVILVVRNDIPNARVKYITRNYIASLEKMRDGIDMDNYLIELNNISSEEFNYNELVSFDSVVPLNEGAKEVYIEEGLIYKGDADTCDV
uniref:Uncharacterized protein n=1 Tax=viral metagenome TaxID=1070528 RepID=A0A6C0HP94_9ZZZZ